MARVLKTEKIWKTGDLASLASSNSKPETDDDLLKHAISNVMEALQRNIESKRSACKDKILMHIFTMNSYWYIYMRTKSTELGELLGEKYLKEGFKTMAEESAYMYQKNAWGVLVRVLETEELGEKGKEREKVETFLKGLEEICGRHRGGNGYCIPDLDLREQIKEATVKLVVKGYVEFLESCKGILERKGYVSVERVKGLVVKAFDGGDGRLKRRGSGSNEWNGGRNSGSLEGDMNMIRR